MGGAARRNGGALHLFIQPHYPLQNMLSYIQEKTLNLNIDAIRNAYALDVVAEPYVDLRKLGNKLEGAATYESHKQRG